MGSCLCTAVDEGGYFTREARKELQDDVKLPAIYSEPNNVIILMLIAGSVKSLISLPCFMSHASIPAEVRKARGLTEDLIRVSVRKYRLLDLDVIVAM